MEGTGALPIPLFDMGAALLEPDLGVSYGSGDSSLDALEVATPDRDDLAVGIA